MPPSLTSLTGGHARQRCSASRGAFCLAEKLDLHCAVPGDSRGCSLCCSTHHGRHGAYHCTGPGGQKIGSVVHTNLPCCTAEPSSSLHLAGAADAANRRNENDDDLGQEKLPIALLSLLERASTARHEAHAILREAMPIVEMVVAARLRSHGGAIHERRGRQRSRSAKVAT